MMDDVAGYRILLRGWVQESEVNPLSPYPLEVRPVEGRPGARLPVTEIRVRTDQSGMIGLLRYLHGRGFVVLSLARTE